MGVMNVITGALNFAEPTKFSDPVFVRVLNEGSSFVVL